jgi:hypothetical protein
MGGADLLRQYLAAGRRTGHVSALPMTRWSRATWQPWSPAGSVRFVSGAERRALNENVFREMNERLERLGEEFGDDKVEFLCECADPSCSAALFTPAAVYEAVRTRPRRFLVVPGHERPGFERVVEEHADYLVIEKLGEAGEVAEDTDPRA